MEDRLLPGEALGGLWLNLPGLLPEQGVPRAASVRPAHPAPFRVAADVAPAPEVVTPWTRPSEESPRAAVPASPVESHPAADIAGDLERLAGSLAFHGGRVRAAANDLPVSTSTYLSGPVSDNGAAVDVAPDGTNVFAGRVNGNDFGLTPTALLGGGTGAVIRFDPTGTTPLSLTRIGNDVLDTKVNRVTGEVAAVGDFGLAVLTPDAGAVEWNAALGGSSNKRVAFGDDGTVAALDNKTIRTFDAAGNPLGQWTLTNTLVNDVAVDANSGSVFVAADDNKRLPSGLPVRVAVVYAYDYAGNSRWTDYGWAGGQLAGNEADSNAVRVSLGRDGLLYLAAYSAGGNSMFRSLPTDLSRPAPNVAYDNYTNPFNTGSNNILYFARLNPADGSHLGGQFVLTRLPSGRGNTIQPRAIAADENGTIYVAGNAAAFLANRDAQTVAGQPVGPYRGDPYLLVVSPDFRQRLIWTTWSGGTDGGGGRLEGVAVANGQAAVAGNVTAGAVITYQAVQDGPGHDPSNNNPAAFFAAFPAL